MDLSNTLNVNATSSVGTPAAPAIGPANASAPFAGVLKDAIGQVDILEDQARSITGQLMTGNSVDVHQAVIATEKAQMVFELTLAVRNKAIQAYQGVMNMQF